MGGDWRCFDGDVPLPTDREREIALEVGRVFDERSGRPALLTAMAHALARYRLELEQARAPKPDRRELIRQAAARHGERA